jgi:hypothetical protein
VLSVRETYKRREEGEREGEGRENLRALSFSLSLCLTSGATRERQKETY